MIFAFSKGEFSCLQHYVRLNAQYKSNVFFMLLSGGGVFKIFLREGALGCLEHVC